MTNWQTPRILYDELSSAVGGFACDAAADDTNHLASDWYGPGSSLAVDALKVEQWLSPVFCNPPYGRGIERWLEKFVEQQSKGVTIVALLPANTEVRWWYEYVVPFASIVFLVGRVPFTNPQHHKHTQPDHGSAICLYEPGVVGGAVGWLDWKVRNAIRNTGSEGVVTSIDPDAQSVDNQ